MVSRFVEPDARDGGSITVLDEWPTGGSPFASRAFPPIVPRDGFEGWGKVDQVANMVAIGL